MHLDQVKDFDVLGHLDYVVRYGENQGAGVFLSEAFADEIDEILKKVDRMREKDWR